MNTIFSLKYKFILHTLFFVTAAMLAVGWAIDHQLQNIFYKDAKEQVYEMLQDVSAEMEHSENNTLETLYALSSSDSMMASLHMINTYEDRRDYNAILFDEEKKRIAQILGNEGKPAYNDTIAVYDGHSTLVAFVVTSHKEMVQGYVSYRDGRPLVFTRTNRAGAYEEGEPPAAIPFGLQLNKGAFQGSTIAYRVAGDELELTGSSTITRETPDAQRKNIGYIHTSKTISHDAMRQMSRNTHIRVDYFIDDVAAAGHHALFAQDELKRAPLLFSKFSPEEMIFAAGTELYAAAVRLFVDSAEAYVMVDLDRYVLSQALYQGRKTLLWIFGAVYALIILASVLWVNRMVSAPLMKLMKGIDVLQNGEHRQKVRIETNDELGLIAGRFNEMAQKIHEREQALERLAHHDVLTKMPNRAMFQKRLEAALHRAGRTGRKGAVFFFDIDQFKSINDTLGHDVGDRLLVEVAGRLVNLLRRNDLLARIGGDEFNMLIEDIESPVYVEKIARKIIDEVRLPFSVGEEDIYITCSIGVTLFPEDATDPVALMKNADMAMYKAKELGRDRYHFFSSSLSQALEERAEMLKALRGAIFNDEFRLFYQPKFSLDDGAILSIEALVRWESPVFGFLLPDRFIPLCEESGMIVQLGRWVLRRACEDFKQWRKMGLALSHISVNVSNIQFMRSDMVQTLKSVLEESGIEPGSLELEITESYIHDAGDAAMRVLHEIRALGVALAIDDFGTGYSSMSYLKRLPLTRLKIDRSFIMDIPHDVNDVEITRAIVALAKVMGLLVTAEGVETVEQMEFLGGLACDEGQGYLCSKPVDSKRLMQLLQNSLCRAEDDDG